MRHIQAYLEDAEAKQGGSRGVANLVIDIQDLACDVEDIMQKYFPRIASHREKGFLGCLKSATCIVCYGYDARNFAVEIEGIKRRVEDINRELIVEEGGMLRLKELGIVLCNPITTIPDRIKNIMKIDNW
ncbi:disease resistance protein RPP8-like [Camellia sinensis]|uniref:disease resistance protein RPP8-like n=1 Tax=Camellia sinensis TaxID=4442 RepID=UPI0010358D85|nr:disease resistance protein RPP8-like [Camellia sinensis]